MEEANHGEISESLPESIDDCRSELARFGLVFQAVNVERKSYAIYAANELNTPVEVFESPLWTELDCAQAALRLARYMFGNGTAIHPKS